MVNLIRRFSIFFLISTFLLACPYELFGSVDSKNSVENFAESSLRKRKKRRRRRRRKRKKKKSNPELQRLRKEALAQRLYFGGTKAIRSEIKNLTDSCGNVRPLLLRFIDCDRSLQTNEIKKLYYSWKRPSQNSLIKEQHTKRLDEAINQKRFADALQICKNLVSLCPTDLTLQSKLCELASHEKDPLLDAYIWRLSELLYAISQSGKGTNEFTAIRTHTVLDALRFERLWFKSKKANFTEMIIQDYLTHRIAKVCLKGKDPNKPIRYYRISKSF